MLTQASSRSRANGRTPDVSVDYDFRVRARWRLREYRNGILVAEDARYNKFTDYGLTNLAQLWGGAGVAPVYLVIDSFKANLVGSPVAGALSIQTDARVDRAGDTQIVLNPGGANQETVSFSSVSGTGPYTYNVSALGSNHTAGEFVTRAIRQADTMASVQAEVQYDAVAAPNQRMKAPAGSGYSQGTGSWTAQFFLTGSQAVTNWMTLGLADNLTVGAGNLHNHITFGFVHTTGNDVELDITLTIANA